MSEHEGWWGALGLKPIVFVGLCCKCMKLGTCYRIPRQPYGVCRRCWKELLNG